MNWKLLVVLSSLCVAGLASAAETASLKVTSVNGQPLNLDFESGNLRDWTATGDAFASQPVLGDVVSKRRGDMKSGHQGDFWIGTYEVHGDDATGTLTSASFKLTQPWASFLIGGGPHEKTRVELITKSGAKEEVLVKVSGQEHETMRRAIVDLQKHVGREVFIRIVDLQKGHWGHVNFDDFVFHAAKPNFPNAIDTTKKVSLVAAGPTDDVKFAGLPAEQAAREMTLPPGFKATLFAGEPDVKQPVAFCIDDRGRLWVAEGYQYPRRKGAPPSPVASSGKPNETQLADIFGGADRILVFEDNNNDGRFDKRHVFLEKLNLVSGLEVGFGGVWIGAAPYLMFVPVTDWDTPKPAGDPQVLLDGWDFLRDTHETLNTFLWGPDGWLYGCHGVFCPSNVGKPGTPKSERQWIDAGVWRYHPTKHVFEVFAEGTSNPWGLDFDEHGQAFIEACVIPHLFHMIQGGRYHRQGGAHYAANADETKRFAAYKEGKGDKTLHPFIYDDIKTHADHLHYLGNNPHAGNNRSDSAGGGHAHAGLLIYQGDNFPAEYRGKMFMNNIHGQRINMDIPERRGSGYVGKHGPDFINFNDKWSQVINLLTGPDGSMFLIDWYDKNQCHHNDVNGHDRGNGRIFKVSYGEPKAARVDVERLSNEALIVAQMHRNNWHAQHARRVSQERAATRVFAESARLFARRLAGLEKQRAETKPSDTHFASTDVTSQLRLLWTLHAVQALTEPDLLALLDRREELVRAWAIQLACEDKSPSDLLLRNFARLAREDASPMVRLYLASALQRLPLEKRGEILEGLLAHAEDAKDHNLPLMYWYAAEPLAGRDVATGAQLLAKTKIPHVREFISRRMTATVK